MMYFIGLKELKEKGEVLVEFQLDYAMYDPEDNISERATIVFGIYKEHGKVRLGRYNTRGDYKLLRRLNTDHDLLISITPDYQVTFATVSDDDVEEIIYSEQVKRVFTVEIIGSSYVEL